MRLARLGAHHGLDKQIVSYPNRNSVAESSSLAGTLRNDQRLDYRSEGQGTVSYEFLVPSKYVRIA